MAVQDLPGYAGKRVVVTGAASGMGEAAVELLHELGAEIHALDISDVSGPAAQFIRTDVGSRESLDQAIEQLPAQIDAIFNIAGVASPPAEAVQCMLINYIGHRYLTEQLLPRLLRGGAIANVSSVAGMRYIAEAERLGPLVTEPDFEAARAWCADNVDPAEGYRRSKEALNLWTAMYAQPYGRDLGVRINAVGPGATETPLFPQFVENVGGPERMLQFQGYLGRYSQPMDQAWALAFLCSPAASFISGQVLYVDAGSVASFTVPSVAAARGS